VPHLIDRRSPATEKRGFGRAFSLTVSLRILFSLVDEDFPGASCTTLLRDPGAVAGIDACL